jgi:hypothetical protein
MQNSVSHPFVKEKRNQQFVTNNWETKSKRNFVATKKKTGELPFSESFRETKKDSEFLRIIAK